MTDTADRVPAEMMEAPRERLREGESNEQRRLSLGDTAVGIEGPLGDLLRTVSAMHDEWLLACDFGAVTDAESRRMELITDSAVECVTWLRGGS